jgi:hypothetical protein
MKNLQYFIGLFLLCSMFTTAQSAASYILLVNGDTLHLQADQNVQYVSNKGESMELKLIIPDEQVYKDDMLSFEYPKKFHVSSNIIQDGIEQFMVMSAAGNGYMIQKYSEINPSGLTKLMMSELVKESVNYGYSKTEESFTKTLTSGHQLEGRTATLTYKGDKQVYTVASWGGRDEGILVVTMIMNEDFKSEEEGFIKLFLESLQIHL